MPEYEVVQQRARCFYDRYERKSELQHQTHYCPGCGHGIVHKLAAKAIDELGIQDRMVLISPVGCSVFAYYYFDVGNVQAAHGRAPAVATGVKRARPESIVLSYQGDGDLAAIGTAEIVHAANRGENITVIFVNNAIYGMTGGQMAPTTLLGQKTTTSPFGRSVWNEGHPIKVCELLASLNAPVYLERVALGNNKQIVSAGRAIRKALEIQKRGLGFSLVEVLSPCPTIWNMDPVAAQQWVVEGLAKTFPLGVYRDRSKEAEARPAPAAAPELASLPRILGIEPAPAPQSPVQSPDRSRDRQGAVTPNSAPTLDLAIKVAGFGGQGVLLLGEVLAEAGLAAGFHVSWLPSYGPEMRSGTSHCHVRISDRPIASPLISRPNILLAMNEPSLRKFLPATEPGGLVLYNGATCPEDCRREGVRIITAPFTEFADALGGAKATNMVMLGALVESGHLPFDPEIIDVLRKRVRNQRWLEIDFAALARGRQAAKKQGVGQASRPVSGTMLQPEVHDEGIHTR
jgi:2-oxoisovalerate ferredoxin oxidoreductase beta subunit